MKEEKRYIMRRIWRARLQSVPFYLLRIFPVKRKKIVFCCIEGTVGYSCNPKYIAKELIRRNEGYELIWLVDDISKRFPKEIRAVRNTLWNRAYHLSTARFWIDNSRKQLEVRKRKGQIYIQTWHAKLGFKPTCLDRGSSFSRIAYLVSRHDSNMIDYVLSNSKWYDDTLPTGMIYRGPTLMTGSPRCDILIRAKNDIGYKARIRRQILQRFGIQRKTKETMELHFLMYAPTFRGGSQETEREIAVGSGFPDFMEMIDCFEKRFGGEWIILLRLHPQLTVRKLGRDMPGVGGAAGRDIVDVSQADDMYEILAGCDAFMTDYSSAAFDAAVMEIPVFLYCDDYPEYERERGCLLWDLKNLPFPMAQDRLTLREMITGFDAATYQIKIERLFEDTKMLEDGKASERVAGFLSKNVEKQTGQGG